MNYDKFDNGRRTPSRQQKFPPALRKFVRPDWIPDLSELARYELDPEPIIFLEPDDIPPKTVDATAKNWKFIPERHPMCCKLCRGIHPGFPCPRRQK